MVFDLRYSVFDHGRKYENIHSYLAVFMPYRLQHITPKCTTDACRAVRHITHVEFDTKEQAQAFVVAHGLNNVRVVEYSEVSERQSATPSSDA